MIEAVYPAATRKLTGKRHALAPETEKAFQAAHCTRGCTESALRQGATRQEIMQAVGIAAEIRAGGA